MKSKVFFIDFRAGYKAGLLQRLGKLIKEAGISSYVKERDLTAVKMHFGEKGNTAFIRPVLVKKIIEDIKKLNANPFLTDTNTLYSGSRSNAIDHLHTAVGNGFAYSVVGVPVIIADGLKGSNEVEVQINKKNIKTAYIAKEIASSDSMVSIAHFKGHELAGFGGSIKNIAMGCASKKGKLAQHSTVSPKIKKKKCVACSLCAQNCVHEAISIEDVAVIDKEKCVGCGECIAVCPNKAVQIVWDKHMSVFLENLVEYAYAVMQAQKNSFFINFITDVSPACDCLPFNDAPIVRDIGVLASHDPVAIDKACVDMVNKQRALEGCCLEKNKEPGADKFKEVHPKVDWEIQIDYANEIGLGNKEYEIVNV